LVRAGAVNEESVHRALAVQGFTGGRIGTLLLERGSVSEDEVGQALAEQHGCEYVPWSQLGFLPPAVIAALPAKFAIRHSALPVEVGEGFVRVVLRDPSNLRILDELFFVTGKKIIPAAAPEVRIYQALEKCYGERRTPRFAILAEKLSRPTAPSIIRKPLPPPPDFSTDSIPLLPGLAPERPAEPEDARPISAASVPDLPSVGWSGLPPARADPGEHDLESIPWEELPGAETAGAEREAGSTAPPAPQPPIPWRRSPVPSRDSSAPSSSPGMPSAADFGEMLAARDRDGVFDAALRALRRRFARSAVFAARPDGVSGWSGAGERVDIHALRRLEIPWSDPSIFLNVRMGQAFYLGPLPPLPRHDALAAALGGWPSECVVQPIRMRDKTVAFLYAECAGAQGATPADLTYLRELAGAAAAALAASIRLKKKQVI
jgi:Type II secretion system (T2SS), protein E, N-terminal domain/GAF domain